MKSTREGHREKSPDYPMLMESKVDNTVVLFSAPTMGVSVSGNDIGFFSRDWNPASFVPFRGAITLEND